MHTQDAQTTTFFTLPDGGWVPWTAWFPEENTWATSAAKITLLSKQPSSSAVLKPWPPIQNRQSQELLWYASSNPLSTLRPYYISNCPDSCNLLAVGMFQCCGLLECQLAPSHVSAVGKKRERPPSTAPPHLIPLPLGSNGILQLQGQTWLSHADHEHLRQKNGRQDRQHVRPIQSENIRERGAGGL